MTISDPQRRFLTLHARHFVESWQQLFQGAMFRARTDRGETVTLRADETNALLTAGLIDVHHGAVYVTPAGEALA